VIPFAADREAVIIRNGNIEDFHAISPETDAENLRMVGALGEMLFEQARRSFRVSSLTVIAQNEDFRIVMFPRDDSIVVWKTNLEVREILSSLERTRSVRGKSIQER
jgi:hypothetical protein